MAKTDDQYLVAAHLSDALEAKLERLSKQLDCSRSEVVRRALLACDKKSLNESSNKRNFGRRHSTKISDAMAAQSR